MTTLEFLLKKFGPLVPLAGVAEIFHRDVDSLRQQVAREEGLGALLAPAKWRRGRGIFFKSLILADILDAADGE